jgi:hypothetical protein
MAKHVGVDFTTLRQDMAALERMEDVGETDVLVIGEVGNANNGKTMFSLKLLDTSVSKRRDGKPLKNPYFEGGRMRQEQVIVDVGHLCSVTVSSDAMPPEDVRTSENFSIRILRNSGIVGHKPIERIERRDLSALCQITDHEILNVKARQDQLLDFLRGGDGNSSLTSHRDGVRVLHALFQNLTGRPSDFS